MTEKDLTICHIIGTYPGISNTFIDREIGGLRRQGMTIRLLSIRRPDLPSALSPDQKRLAQEVIYLLPVKGLGFIWGHLRFLLTQPRVYLGTLFYLMTRSFPSFRDRWMTVLHFAEGGYAAHLLRKESVNHLHAHFADRAATVALVAGRLLGIPYSLGIHAGEDIFVHPVLLPEKFAGAKFVISCTQYNLDYLKQMGIPDLDKKAFAIHHGLDFDRYGLTSQPQSPPLLLSVGRLVEKKGFDYLIRACRRLKDTGRAFVCHIIGSGPDRHKLEALIVELGLQETVVLRGVLPHDQVVEEYNRATLFALPCIQGHDGSLDGIPNVLPEAMASWLPVVSTPVSAIPELIEDQQNGMLVLSEDDAALAAALARLLDDPALCRQLGQMGRQSIIEKFNIDRNVHAVYEIFMRLGGPDDTTK